MKKIKQTTRKPIAKLKKPYEGGDALMEWHKEKTRTATHNTDYFTPMWRCETDWDRTKDYLTWIAMWAGLLGCLYLLATWFEGVM
jgi:hypothetical protein